MVFDGKGPIWCKADTLGLCEDSTPICGQVDMVSYSWLDFLGRIMPAFSQYQFKLYHRHMHFGDFLTLFWPVWQQNFMFCRVGHVFGSSHARDSQIDKRRHAMTPPT